VGTFSETPSEAQGCPADGGVQKEGVHILQFALEVFELILVGELVLDVCEHRLVHLHYLLQSPADRNANLNRQEKKVVSYILTLYHIDSLVDVQCTQKKKRTFKFESSKKWRGKINQGTTTGFKLKKIP
jgi:hypothetical protein